MHAYCIETGTSEYKTTQKWKSLLDLTQPLR